MGKTLCYNANPHSKATANSQGGGYTELLQYVQTQKLQHPNSSDHKYIYKSHIEELEIKLQCNTNSFSSCGYLRLL